MTTAAVVPLFAPSEDVVDRLTDLAKHTRVVVVDDSPDLTEESLLARLTARGVVVLRHERNRGIAAALNTGIAHVTQDHRITSILTLDQDSTAPRHYIEAAETLLSTEPLGLVYPHMLNGEPQVGSRRDGVWEALEPMQSGWMLKSDVWFDVGPFREELVIDCVDTDYFLRVLDRGWRAKAVMDMSIDHELGTPHQLFGRISYRRHPPFRTYYMVRNRILTARLHGRRHRSWATRSLVRTLKDIAKALVLGDRRTDTLFAVARAVRDGAGPRKTLMTQNPEPAADGGPGRNSWRG